MHIIYRSRCQENNSSGCVGMVGWYVLITCSQLYPSFDWSLGWMFDKPSQIIWLELDWTQSKFPRFGQLFRAMRFAHIDHLLRGPSNHREEARSTDQHHLTGTPRRYLTGDGIDSNLTGTIWLGMWLRNILVRQTHQQRQQFPMLMRTGASWFVFSFTQMMCDLQP